MPIISFQRHIKLTNEDALKIMNHKPSKKLQDILKSIESKDIETQTKNKLVSKYIEKKSTWASTWHGIHLTFQNWCNNS